LNAQEAEKKEEEEEETAEAPLRLAEEAGKQFKVPPPPHRTSCLCPLRRSPRWPQRSSKWPTCVACLKEGSNLLMTSRASWTL
jgi:hypothetical protein